MATINCTSVADVRNGTDLIDEIFADAGNDSLVGGAGDDSLNGGAGDDTILGFGGYDTWQATLAVIMLGAATAMVPELSITRTSIINSTSPRTAKTAKTQWTAARAMT
ncbi:MAG: hypothetical protein IPG93_00445 [Burkholderiales bacterium]|nr:hypothetical protein [Burkholderiales bacterium]